MRLLNVRTLRVSEFPDSDELPLYAIASHRWFTGAETSLVEFESWRMPLVRKTRGYHKVCRFCDFVSKHLPCIEWLWVDTCCIDCRSSQDVTKSINSMFKWYRSAALCLAYLADVTWNHAEGQCLSEFKHSEWFDRGWTLQELLAPPLVVFLSKEWKVFGHKGGLGSVTSIDLTTGPLLNKIISDITQIPEEVLISYDNSKRYTYEARAQWLGTRQTTIPEDGAYCMLGILEIHIPLLYGEGEFEAFKRVSNEICKKARARQRPNLFGYRTNPKSALVEDASDAFESPRTGPEPVSHRQIQVPVSIVQPHHQGLLNDRIMIETASWVDRPSARPTPIHDDQQIPYKVLERWIGSDGQDQGKYFLEGRNLSKHIVRRHIRSMAGPSSSVKYAEYAGSHGYLILGRLLEGSHLEELGRLTREHELAKRVDRSFIAPS